MEIGPYRLDLPARIVHGPGGRAELTELEARFLEHLLARRGAVVTTDELLREVWGYHPSIRTKAVRLLVSRLRRKLGDPDLVETASGGYRIPAPDPPLVERVRALVARLDFEPDTLAMLTALRPRIQAALVTEADPAVRARLEIGLGAIATERQEPASALPLWRHAEELSGALGAECALLAARLGATAGHAEEARRALAPWVERCPDDAVGSALRARMLLVLANLDIRLDRAARGLPLAQEALAIADRLGDPRIRGDALCARARLDIGLPDRDDSAAIAALRDGVAILRAVGAEVGAASQASSLGALLYAAGDLSGAEHHLAAAASVLERSGRGLDAAFCRVNLGTVRLGAGDPEAAAAAAREAGQFFSMRLDYIGECSAALLEGRARAALGEREAAEGALRRALTLAERMGMARTAAHARRYLGWCALADGRFSTAEAWFAEVRLSDGDRVPGLFLELWRSWAVRGPGPAGLAEALGGPPWEERRGPYWVDTRLTRAIRRD